MSLPRSTQRIFDGWQACIDDHDVAMQEQSDRLFAWARESFRAGLVLGALGAIWVGLVVVALWGTLT